MKNCKNCGASIIDNAKFCTYCGTAVEVPITENDDRIAFNDQNAGSTQGNQYDYQANTNPCYDAPESGSKSVNVGSLIWSLISTFICCTPLGVVALIFTLMASSAEAKADEIKKLSYAKLFNILSIVAIVLLIIIYVVGIAVAISSGVFEVTPN